ncbi:MAG: long-chain fatty acid--CoA ligase [Alphaproteobacteria bacterium]|nr:long-chain fatty acid--CoA ligase [Alphaproteobacteria bacterium]
MIKHPWVPNYPEHVAWDQEFVAKPLYALLEDTAARFPDGIAYDFMGKETRYRDLLDQANCMACGLQKLGVGKGSHVGIFMPNCPQFAVAYFGILKTGGTVVNYSPLYSERELIAQVEDSETDIMITLDLAVLYPVIHAVTRKSRLKHLVVDAFSTTLPFPKNFLFKWLQGSRISRPVRDQYYVNFRQLLDNDASVAPVDIEVNDDVAVIQYTGGTTGVPKGAMLTHANIYINVLQLEKWTLNLELDHEILPGFLPFFHVFSMTVIMNMGIYIGAKVVILPKFELAAAVKLMKKHRPTLFAGVPTMFTALLNYGSALAAGLDNVKMCMSGGAPLPVELEQAFRDRMGIAISEGYGLTETSPVCTSNPYDRDTRKGSIGLPLPATEVIIIDRKDPTKILPLGENGEICIRGPQVMKGYWKHPEATAQTIIDGILHTGDVGYMDDDGYSYIIDRDKDLILVGGFNVYPRVVEEAIYQHPAVHEATVIGVPDDYLGERPKAFVTLKEGVDPITPEDLMAFLRNRLGKHERPREIEFRTELPKTMIGKLSKKELVAEEKAKYEKRKKA